MIISAAGGDYKLSSLSKMGIALSKNRNNQIITEVGGFLVTELYVYFINSSNTRAIPAMNIQKTVSGKSHRTRIAL